MTRKQITRLERQGRRAYYAHLEAIRAALTDEAQRFNAAQDGSLPPAVLPTAFGPYIVASATSDLDVTCYPLNGRRDEYSRRTFMLANDGRWADLLAQAEVSRHPLFAAGC